MIGMGEDRIEPARVLVVEDVGQLREMLVEKLADAGFAVDGADSVRQARGLDPETYAALVVDDRLGDGSGIDLFRELCERDESVASRFILMTGDGGRATAAVGVPVLVKPFRLAVLAVDLREELVRPCGAR
jgi:DNA-binding response OmpR family regulator